MVDVIGKTVLNAMKKMIEAVEESTASSRMVEQLRPLRRDAYGGGLRRPSAVRAVGCDRPAQPST
eukprot:6719159-Heterocapsa_arctica.AAC.1